MTQCEAPPWPAPWQPSWAGLVVSSIHAACVFLLFLTVSLLLLTHRAAVAQRRRRNRTADWPGRQGVMAPAESDELQEEVRTQFMSMYTDIPLEYVDRSVVQLRDDRRWVAGGKEDRKDNRRDTRT